MNNKIVNFKRWFVVLLLPLSYWVFIIWPVSANWTPVISLRNSYDVVLYRLKTLNVLPERLVRILSPEEIVVTRRIKGTNKYMYRLSGKYVNSKYVGERFYLWIEDSHGDVYKFEMPLFTDGVYANGIGFFAGDYEVGTDVGSMVRNEYYVAGDQGLDTISQHGSEILNVAVYWKDERSLSEIKEVGYSRFNDSWNYDFIKTEFVIFTRENVW